jgi:hypothetical protein
MAAMNTLVISVLSRAGHTGNAARRELGCDQTGALALLGLLPKRHNASNT